MSSKHALKHLGLIIDGNRRWAKQQGLTSLEGHKAGYQNVKTIAKAAFDKGIEFISVYTFSTENWNRSKTEVDYLMKLLVWVADNELEELNEKNIKVLFLGSRQRLQKRVISAMEKAESRTQNNSGGTLLLCMNYGGQLEIAEAMKAIVAEGVEPDKITPEIIEEHLYGGSAIPAVDMVIRTSGEQRLSNFMLWRAAYSELYFVSKHWPDFDETDLEQAVNEFNNRSRRFGGN